MKNGNRRVHLEQPAAQFRSRRTVVLLRKPSVVAEACRLGPESRTRKTGSNVNYYPPMIAGAHLNPTTLLDHARRVNMLTRGSCYELLLRRHFLVDRCGSAQSTAIIGMSLRSYDQNQTGKLFRLRIRLASASHE